eukprot:scaffold97439_cov45-Attheya_sp.AAC.2
MKTMTAAQATSVMSCQQPVDLQVTPVTMMSRQIAVDLQATLLPSNSNREWLMTGSECRRRIVLFILTKSQRTVMVVNKQTNVPLLPSNSNHE